MRIPRTHIFILLGLIALVLIFLFVNYSADKIFLAKPVSFGVSYSPKYALELGLDPKITFQDILGNLQVKNIRLSAYWDEIEPTKDKFDFTDLDWYLAQAQKQNTKVILALGYKLPRWPECRVPKWIYQEDLKLLRERQLIMVGVVIDHFNSSSTISAWQIENEPILEFGDCPKVDREFLKQEVAFVRSKTQKPIIITDAGELRPWKTPMQLSDIFGTTLYRVVETPFIGQFQYPFKPYIYRIRSDLVRKIFAPKNQKTIISELQAEGWASEPLKYLPIESQIKRFSLDQFRENVNFARKTGFPEAYLWGVEWWYYLSANGYPEYLEYAKGLF